MTNPTVTLDRVFRSDLPQADIVQYVQALDILDGYAQRQGLPPCPLVIDWVLELSLLHAWKELASPQLFPFVLTEVPTFKHGPVTVTLGKKTITLEPAPANVQSEPAD